MFCNRLYFVRRHFFLGYARLKMVYDPREYAGQRQSVSALRQAEGEQLSPRTSHQCRLYLRTVIKTQLFVKISIYNSNTLFDKTYGSDWKAGMPLAQCTERKSNLAALSQM